jgi:hypothetical protein
MTAQAAVEGPRREQGRSFTLALTPRVRFALKTALAITIAYMVPLAMGWNQPYQGAVAIMVIAAAGPLHETLGKGVMRVLGTVAGAAVGLALLALFPQDPLGYFLTLSILAAVLVYLYYAYRGDGTFLLVTLMVMVLIFNEGKVDDRFLYALDRSWTTAFGIFVYAMVNLYLWPEKAEAASRERVRELHGLWARWRRRMEGDAGEDRELWPRLLATEAAWEKTLRQGETLYLDGIALDPPRWERLRPIYRRIDRHLARLGVLGLAERFTALEECFPEVGRLWREIGEMMESTERWWERPRAITLPPAFDDGTLRPGKKCATLPPLERAELLGLARELARLHGGLRELSARLDRIVSALPDPGEWVPEGSSGLFRFSDSELWRNTLRSMLVFWSGLLLWHYLHPQLGYMVAALGLVLSLVVFGMRINPLALILIYSLSFLVSFVAYVWILPQLYGGWELALYIFGYMFLTFWLIPVPLALFFGLGLSFQYILNDKFFSFEIFLAMLMLFYLFLGLLLLFYYLPFSNRPERVFLRSWREWKRGREARLCGDRGASAGRMRAALERIRAMATSLDRRYFDRVDYGVLERWLEEAERATALMEMEEEARRQLPRALHARIGKTERCGKGEATDAKALQKRLAERNRELEGYSLPPGEAAADLAEYLALRHAFVRSAIRMKGLEEMIGEEQLRWSRF